MKAICTFFKRIRNFLFVCNSLILSLLLMQGNAQTLTFKMEAYEYYSASCPWVFTWDGNNYVKDNDIYSVARYTSGEYTDYYALNKPLKLTNGNYLLRIEEIQFEESYSDFYALKAVDHAPGVAVAPDDKGNIYVDGQGEVIEYAVRMKQLDPSLIMSELLVKNKIFAVHLQKLAHKIFDFHQRAIADAETASFGSVEMIQFNWNENFEQTEKYKQKIIPENDFSFMRQKINTFIAKNKELFAKRVAQGKIKHCHGDFHSANVFVTPEIYIFDGIVFNKRFPCSDVIAEVAFMSMDLNFHGKKELAEVFVKEYQRLSNDKDIPKLLDFYKCYRAYIRGKINCFTSEDSNLTTEEKEKTINGAKKYFQLAKNYAELL